MNGGHARPRTAGAGSSGDPTKIAGWFERAALLGNLTAAFNLGGCFAKGVGVERNDEQAASWLRRAADGVPEAQHMYGRLLAEGRGVSPDPRGERRSETAIAAARAMQSERSLAPLGGRFISPVGGRRAVGFASEV